MTSKGNGIVVFGGGTATNSLVDVFEALRASRGPGATLSYVIPISDNGGSSSELIRVFGGPGIGDLRSRLVRMIPDSDTDPERASLKELFNHRLPEDHALARAEWLDIVESRHHLWSPGPSGAGISSEKRELIRSIFNMVNMEIVKRARPSSVFNFSRASIGNLFLTGGRVLTGSLESAVYLLASICGVPEQVRVVPAINSSFTHHISAGLANGDTITGQNNISHPSAPTALPDDGSSRGMMANGGEGIDLRDETAMLDLIEDATLPGSLPTLRKPYISFNKGGGVKTPNSSGTGQQTPNLSDTNSASNAFGQQLLEGVVSGLSPAPTEGHGETGGEQDLPARIDRIWYINPYGHEIWPPANPKVVSSILNAGAVVYSIGSLYTSIIPSLVLRGVGAALASSQAKHKILILNSSLDRETSGPVLDEESGAFVYQEFAAADFVRSIVRACVQSQGELPARMARRSSLSYQVRRPRKGAQEGQRDTVASPTQIAGDNKTLKNDEDDFDSPLIVRRYVTHLVYLEGHGVPKVNKEVLTSMGVDCIRVYGRRAEGSSPVTTTAQATSQLMPPSPTISMHRSHETGVVEGAPGQQQQVTAGGELRYDIAGLTRALEAVVSRREIQMRSRRNTSGQ